MYSLGVNTNADDTSTDGPLFEMAWNDSDNAIQTGESQLLSLVIAHEIVIIFACYIVTYVCSIVCSTLGSCIES